MFSYRIYFALPQGTDWSSGHAPQGLLQLQSPLMGLGNSLANVLQEIEGKLPSNDFTKLWDHLGSI